MTDQIFARTYGVELLCAQRPQIPKRELLARLQQLCPGAEPLDGNRDSELLSFVHTDVPVELRDARVFAQTFIAISDKRPNVASYADAIQQSWNFPEARDSIANATTAVLLTDVMSGGLEYKTRVSLIERALRALLDFVPCEAIHWGHSARIIDPSAWRTELDEGDPAQRFFAGPVNVRLFNVEAEGTQERELVMDTLGLAALGLPDLQCRFRGLDPQRMAALLYNTAWYIFQNGDVIEDGNTIAGIAPASRWKCQHENSLVGPERVVLDLDPGVQHDAGNRTER